MPQIEKCIENSVLDFYGENIDVTKIIKTKNLKKNILNLDLELGFYGNKNFIEKLKSNILNLDGIDNVDLEIKTKIQSHSGQPNLKNLPNVKNIIAVASGKGGVGKSTTAINLALALSQQGARVGIVDADIYGPSQPTLLNHHQKPTSPDGKKILPEMAHGLQCMSMGFFIDPNSPMVWRGPMVSRGLEQLVLDTQWDNLDYLFVDLPPGTGDIQLTLSQKIPVSGSVIVTTPQDLALIDAKKAVKMFNKVHVPVLGIVENMAMHICSQCGHTESIFGEGGGEAMAGEFKIDLLGQLPLDKKIRLDADAGKPSVLSNPESKPSQIYHGIASKIAIKLSQRKTDFRAIFPQVVVEAR